MALSVDVFGACGCVGVCLEGGGGEGGRGEGGWLRDRSGSIDMQGRGRERGREGRGEKIERTTATEAATATGGGPIEEGVQNEKRG